LSEKKKWNSYFILSHLLRSTTGEQVDLKDDLDNLHFYYLMMFMNVEELEKGNQTIDRSEYRR
jgi:hypothetical protein